MYMKDDYDLSLFEWWGGAKYAAERITEADKWDEFENVLEEMAYEDGIPSITDVNYLLWFEPEYVFDLLGMLTDEEREELGLD